MDTESNSKSKPIGGPLAWAAVIFILAGIGGLSALAFGGEYHITATENQLTYHIRPIIAVGAFCMAAGFTLLMVVFARPLMESWMADRSKPFVWRALDFLPATFFPAVAVGFLVVGVISLRYELAVTNGGIRHRNHLFREAFEAQWAEIARIRLTTETRRSWHRLRTTKKRYLEITAGTKTARISVSGLGRKETKRLVTAVARHVPVEE
ncbi:hypothetical protein ACFL59_01235 [Planctomycetota bacterium]